MAEFQEIDTFPAACLEPHIYAVLGFKALCTRMSQFWRSETSHFYEYDHRRFSITPLFKNLLNTLNKQDQLYAKLSLKSPP